MSEGALDLGGDWAGTYSYPRGLAPVSFAANLSEQGGWLTGVTEEKSAIGDGLPRLMRASLKGRRIGSAVTWLKMYEDREVHHDVEYEGAVSADGGEISGRWSLIGSWSGAFLMVRKSRAAVARQRRARVNMGA